MTVRELKKILEKAPESVLDREIGYNIQDLGCSGFIDRFALLKEDLYYDFGDDPSLLRTKKELLDEGYTEEDIEMDWAIEIHRGDPIFIM